MRCARLPARTAALSTTWADERGSGLRAALDDRVLVALMGAGLLVRAVLAVAAEPVLAFTGDDRVYVEGAAALRQTGELDTGAFVRPPLYFLFLAATSWLAERIPGSWALTTMLLQSVASTATAIPVYAAARRIAGVRAARLAAAFLLFDPTLVAYTHMLWPETLYLLFASLVFHGIGEPAPRPGWREAGLGALAGAAMLTKPVFGLFTLLLFGWWVRALGLRAALRFALVFGGVAAIVVAPWLIRNQLRYGPAILLENQAAYNLWIGNGRERPWEVRDAWAAMDDPVERSRTGFERGLAGIAADPAAAARRAVDRALRLWGLEFFAVRHLAYGGYGDISRSHFLAAFWVIQLAWAAAWIAAAAGLGTAARDPGLRLVLVFAVVFTALVSLMVGTTRFRVPFAFPLSIAAGVGVTRLLSRRLSLRSLVPVGVALLLLAHSAARPMFRQMITGRFASVRELQTRTWYFFEY